MMAWCSCIAARASQPVGKPSDQSSTSLYRTPSCPCHSLSTVTYCVTAASFLVQGCVSSQLEICNCELHLCTFMYIRHLFNRGVRKPDEA